MDIMDLAVERLASCFLRKYPELNSQIARLAAQREESNRQLLADGSRAGAMPQPP
jgi:hypothetical protein